jgi:large subunit ribosomal protein L30
MATKKKISTKKLKLTLIRSTRGTLAAHKASVAGLGLKKMHQTVEVQDNPCVRGMIQKAAFLLRVEE